MSRSKEKAIYLSFIPPPLWGPYIATVLTRIWGFNEVFRRCRGTETVERLPTGQRLLPALGRGGVRQIRQLRRGRSQRDALSARSRLRRFDQFVRLDDR